MSDNPITDDGKPYAKYSHLPDGRKRRCGNCVRFAQCKEKHPATFVYAERGGCIHHLGERKTK